MRQSSSYRKKTLIESDGRIKRALRLQSKADTLKNDLELGVRPPSYCESTKKHRLPCNFGERISLNSISDANLSILSALGAHGWTKSRGVDSYRKLNDIEEGAYGWVARATDNTSRKLVAIKKLKFQSHEQSGLPTTGLREVQILRLCHHRNIVALREVVCSKGTPRMSLSIYLVFDFVEHDVKSILNIMVEPFLASEVKMLLLQLGSGIVYLHDRCIIHRDLKPSNLLLTNHGLLKIADFGMARFAGTHKPLHLTREVVTLWYRSPELLLGTSDYDAAVDVWSIGCIFGELIDRTPLLPGSNEIEQLVKIFELCGTPTVESWPDFRDLLTARSVPLPHVTFTKPAIKSRFPHFTVAGLDLLIELLSLDPNRRPSAREILEHGFFKEDPRPRPERLFPTFPSKANCESH